ncbi:MAG: hypothetical protein ACD_29C00254G0001, partial [uncultured bacterium]
MAKIDFISNKFKSQSSQNRLSPRRILGTAKREE